MAAPGLRFLVVGHSHSERSIAPSRGGSAYGGKSKNLQSNVGRTNGDPFDKLRAGSFGKLRAGSSTSSVAPSVAQRAMEGGQGAMEDTSAVAWGAMADKSLGMTCSLTTECYNANCWGNYAKIGC